MRIWSGVVVACVVAFSGGYLVQGQNREKPAEKAAEKTKAASPAAAAPAQPGKKPGAPAKVESTNPAEDPDEKLIRASAEVFTKLYNAHDSKGLAALFAPKAEMIDEDDNVVKGREAIEREFAKVFKEYPQASMQVDVESVRVLTSMLGIEEGTARSKDAPDDDEDVTVYVAIHVKIDGKWQLACVRDWDAPNDALSPHDLLARDLSWLIGEWIDESPESTVRTTCKWHDNRNFLMQEFEVNVQGEIAMSGTMRIGWNAVSNQFQSWVFDSHGGSATGFWQRSGDGWIVKMQGATATGEVASSTNSYRLIDKDTIAWSSTDRVIDGEEQDDVDEIVVKRRPPPPAN
jgi:uncharacterized protein (TIGR02246 family)